MTPVDISVVIPTWRRTATLIQTLEKILACDPAPAEVLVHVDAGDSETAPALKRQFPAVVVIESRERMGPGGGRNRLVERASHGLVASFDDDSYPVDADYFARAARLAARIPDAAVIAAEITDRPNPVPESRPAFAPAVHFGGGGVVLRRSAFLEAGGHVPLPLAYGMEEVDLCLRLLDRGRAIYRSPWLRVFHDNDLSHHARPEVNAASIANLALLAFLRYPKGDWPHGALQVARRVGWCIGAGRARGIASGIASIPALLWRHRARRAPVSPATLAAFRRARRASPPLQPVG